MTVIQTALALRHLIQKDIWSNLISLPKLLGSEIKDGTAINICSAMLSQGNPFWWVLLTLLTRDDDTDAHVYWTSMNTLVTMAGFGGNEMPMQFLTNST
jgi:hypothetical protein